MCIFKVNYKSGIEFCKFRLLFIAHSHSWVFVEWEHSKYGNCRSLINL